jgi:hypothetical protein
MEQASAGGDRQIIDAGVAGTHQTICFEIPVLVAVSTEPVARVVVVLISETNGNAAAGESPEFLYQAIIQLAVPLAGQEGDGGRPCRNSLRLRLTLSSV